MRNKNWHAAQRKIRKKSNNPETRCAKNSLEFFRSLFAFYEQLVKTRVSRMTGKIRHYSYRAGRKKKTNGGREREFYFQIARAPFCFFKRNFPRMLAENLSAEWTNKVFKRSRYCFV